MNLTTIDRGVEIKSNGIILERWNKIFVWDLKINYGIQIIDYILLVLANYIIQLLNWLKLKIFNNIGMLLSQMCSTNNIRMYRY